MGRGDCTYDTDEDAERGYCNGGCVLRPHKFWTDRGPAAVCQRHGCNVAGTGDRCDDLNLEVSLVSVARATTSGQSPSHRTASSRTSDRSL